MRWATHARDGVDRAWSVLPPMTEERENPSCCALPSGRVAVVGGARALDRRTAREGTHSRATHAFNPVLRTWQPLPPMPHGRSQHGVVAVGPPLAQAAAQPAAAPCSQALAKAGF